MLNLFFSNSFQAMTVQRLLKSVKIWQSYCHIQTVPFYIRQSKCGFLHLQVMCAHIRWCDNFTIFACSIHASDK